MDLLIASRQSDLARLQAMQVGQALQQLGHQVTYHFRESLGDINQEDPLWKMPEKGVFTEDFREGLIKGEWDMVVHSWKDLPIDPLPETSIVATLPRADSRDVFVCKKKRLNRSSQSLVVYTSSPRRIYNLGHCLADLFPQKLDTVEFENVRGNILTRVRKLIENENIDGLVVAKAALDRLLDVKGDEFDPGKTQLKSYLDQCRYQVLPLSENPTAAAQGALAVEIKNDRVELKKVLQQIHCQKTWDAVNQERKILKAHGGGCHQKIGVSCLTSHAGKVQFLRGETESGDTLNEVTTDQSEIILKNPCQNNPSFFDRKPINYTRDKSVLTHYISRSTAVPDGESFSDQEIIWASGVETWKKMAKRGYWVSGCSDSLGEDFDGPLGPLFSDRQWYRWTHDRAPDSLGKKTLATYHLQPVDKDFQLENFSEYYWMSGTQFERAIELNPKILQAQHFCGPGHTYQKIKSVLEHNNRKNQVTALVSRQLWLKAIKD